MALKIMLISIVVLAFLIIITRGIVGSLSLEERYVALKCNIYPTHIIVLGLLIALSFIETFASVLYWIVSL